MDTRERSFLGLTDAAALSELGSRLARYRLQRNMTQAELAREAGVSPSTIARLEGGESTQLTNLIRVVRALDLLGNLDVFVPPPAPNPIELLEMQGRQRQRASSRAKEDGAASDEPWTWGESSEGARDRASEDAGDGASGAASPSRTRDDDTVD